MSARTILSFPKGLKATLYTTNSYWQLYKDETMLLSFEIRERWAQHEDVPLVQCRDPRKRTGHSRHLGDPSERFLLIVEGWDCPDIPAWDGTAHVPVHDRARFRPYLARFRDRIIAYSSGSGRKLLVDVHEALTAPHHMTEPERNRTWKSFKARWGPYRDGRTTLADLREGIARDAFPAEEDFAIMAGDPTFVEMLDRLMREAIAKEPEIVEKFDRLMRGT